MFKEVCLGNRRTSQSELLKIKHYVSVMSIIPKRTKYRFKFRIKTEKKKVKPEKVFLNRTFLNFGHKSGLVTSSTSEKPEAYKTSHLKAWLPECGKSSRAFGTKQSFPYDRSNHLLFGTYGFAFQNHGTLSSAFIDTVRLDLSRSLKKKAKLWLRLCCDTPYSARPVETRMGKGKGAVTGWIAKVEPGQIFFEFSGISKTKANLLLNQMLKKSPYGLKLKGA